MKIHDPDQVYIRNGCILMHTGGFSKLLDPCLMQQWFWGYFHKKILRLTLIVSYIELFIFILIFIVPHQNDMDITQWRQMPHFWNGTCNLLKANKKKFFLKICLNSPLLPHFIQTWTTAVNDIATTKIMK